MPLTSYSELTAAVSSWLARDDLAPQVPDFIALFEAAANRRLRVRPMEAATTMTPAGGAVALPADYLAWRRLTFTGSPRRELEYVHPSWLQAAYPDSAAGDPTYFTIEAGTLAVRPVSDTLLALLYWQRIPALGASTPTNWLLAAHPDAYLFGALCEANAFVQSESAVIWKQRRDEAFDEIEALSRKSSGPAAIRPTGPVI